MTLLLDTARIDDANRCGFDFDHDADSESRLRLFREFGEWTLARGIDQLCLSDEAFEDMLEGVPHPNPLHLTREERKALDDVRWEALSREGAEARNQFWGAAA